LTEEIDEQQVSNDGDGLEHEMVDGFHEADGDVDALIDDIHREWREHEAKAVSEDRYMDENGVGALQIEGPVKICFEEHVCAFSLGT